MSLQKVFVVFSMGLVIMFAGCSDSGDSPNDSNNNNNNSATFTTVNGIIQSSCGTGTESCHSGGKPASGLIMESYNSIIGDVASQGKTVDSGNSAGSNLFLKVTSNHPFGNRMPLGRDTLTSAQQKLIKDWIDNGAKND